MQFFDRLLSGIPVIVHGVRGIDRLAGAGDLTGHRVRDLEVLLHHLLFAQIVSRFQLQFSVRIQKHNEATFGAHQFDCLVQ